MEYQSPGIWMDWMKLCIFHLENKNDIFLMEKILSNKMNAARHKPFEVGKCTKLNIELKVQNSFSFPFFFLLLSALIYFFIFFYFQISRISMKIMWWRELYHKPVYNDVHTIITTYIFLLINQRWDSSENTKFYLFLLILLAEFSF